MIQFLSFCVNVRNGRIYIRFGHILVCIVHCKFSSVLYNNLRTIAGNNQSLSGVCRIFFPNTPFYSRIPYHFAIQHLLNLCYTKNDNAQDNFCRGLFCALFLLSSYPIHQYDLINLRNQSGQQKAVLFRFISIPC